MRPTRIVSKALAITLFVSLLTGFVAYRSGMFTEFLYASDRFSSENDSTKSKRDSLLQWQSDSMRMLDNMRATSSKSGAIFEGKVIPREVKDTLDTIKVAPTFMGSSKSINPVIKERILKLDSSK